MKKKPTKRTNWKQKYESLNSTYNIVNEIVFTKAKEITRLKQDFELEKLNGKMLAQKAAELTSGIHSKDTTIKQLEHTLTILTQTGIATKEQCEFARKLAETIVRNTEDEGQEILDRLPTAHLDFKINPVSPLFQGLPYHVETSGVWQGIDRTSSATLNSATKKEGE